MFKSLEVKSDIYWVGALDFDLRIFDIIMYSDYGTTYNSYIVKGNNKTVLFETAKEKFFNEFIERINDVCDPSTIDYVVVNHTEPDHSGSLRRLLDINPNIEVIGTPTAIKFLKNIVNKDFKSIPVKNGDSINIGGKTLEFIIVPFLHWPDTMYTYIKESKTLVTCDSFGCHYCDDNVFNDKIHVKDEVGFMDAYKYYFDCIMGPFKQHVLTGLDKIKDLDIETICNGHGPVIRKNPEKYIQLYREWATVEKREKPKVVIAYVTSYNYTKNLAQCIAKGIKETADVDVEIYDLLDDTKEVVLKAIYNSDGLLLGSPTLIGDTLPQIWEILTGLNPFINKGLVVGAFGSYGWSGEAVDNIEQRFAQLRFKTPIPGLKVCFNPSEDEMDKAYKFGRDFVSSIIHK